MDHTRIEPRTKHRHKHMLKSTAPQQQYWVQIFNWLCDGPWAIAWEIQLYMTCLSHHITSFLFHHHHASSPPPPLLPTMTTSTHCTQPRWVPPPISSLSRSEYQTGQEPAATSPTLTSPSNPAGDHPPLLLSMMTNPTQCLSQVHHPPIQRRRSPPFDENKPPTRSLSTTMTATSPGLTNAMNA